MSIVQEFNKVVAYSIMVGGHTGENGPKWLMLFDRLLVINILAPFSKRIELLL